MNLGLKGKNVLVTGGSRGIGKAIAKQFLAEGANVSIVGRTLSTLESTQKELGELTVYQSDLTDKHAREALIKNYLQDHRTIDVLINNVGGSSGSDVLNTQLADFYEAYEDNYYPAVHLSQLAARAMSKAKTGNVVNITSIYGRESGGLVTYNNAKSALISFTKSLANEVIKHGVNVNSVAPGSVLHDSGVWQKRMDESPSKIRQFIEDEIPGGRFGTPEEIANVVVFMASPRASWMVGSCVTVDGGQSKMNM